MAVFRFKLQKVLEAKTSFEELAKRDFADAQRQLTEEKNELQNLIKITADFKLEMAERRRKGSSVMNFQNDLSRDWTNRRNITSQRFKVSRSERLLAEKREKLVQAMKDRKIMEKLREKHLREFKERTSKEELKFSDEIAGRRSFFASDMLSGE